MQGRIAWARLRNGSKSWEDWKLVGVALMEGRAIAMRNAGATSPAGRGYSDAFNEWLTDNRFDISPSHRAKLLTAMGLLPEIEAWRATLTPRQRRRMNHPGAILNNFRKAARIRLEMEHDSPAPAPV